MRGTESFTLAILLTAAAAIALSLSPATAANYSGRAAAQQNDPSTSLSKGRQLLKQGHADQALPLLETALTGFTSANNERGMAAAQDALGDLYMIQGQYKVALD